MKKSLLIELISAFLILLFIYTALTKFYNLPTFRYVLGKSDLLSPFAGFLSVVIPVTELLISAFLFKQNTRLTGLYASFGLMSIFTLYVGFMLLFKAHLPCTCGGIINHLPWTAHFIVNIAVTTIAFAGARLLKNTVRFSNTFLLKKDKTVLLQ